MRLALLLTVAMLAMTLPPLVEGINRIQDRQAEQMKTLTNF